MTDKPGRTVPLAALICERNAKQAAEHHLRQLQEAMRVKNELLESQNSKIHGLLNELAFVRTRNAELERMPISGLGAFTAAGMLKLADGSAAPHPAPRNGNGAEDNIRSGRHQPSS